MVAAGGAVLQVVRLRRPKTMSQVQKDSEGFPRARTAHLSEQCCDCDGTGEYIHVGIEGGSAR